MVNKSTTKEEIKNSVFTPKDVEEAFASLPHNYIVKTQELLQEKVDKELIPKNFSKQYIIKARNREIFQEDILNALVQVGLDNKKSMESFGFEKKKTTSTN